MQIYPDFNFFGGDVVWRIGCTARLAQLVERKALNLAVVGSSPTVGVVYCLLSPWSMCIAQHYHP